MKNPLAGRFSRDDDSSDSGMTRTLSAKLPPTPVQNPLQVDAYTPAQVTAALVNSAIVKDNQRLDHLFIKSLLAGMHLSFGGIFVLIIAGGTNTPVTGLNVIDPGLVKLLEGIFFPIGLYIIVTHGMELFTSNVMIMVMGMLAGKVGIKALLKSWIVSWVGNAIGAIFFAAILVRYTAILAAQPYVNAGTSIITLKVLTPQWHQIFLRAIGCNWLVCLAVWNAAQSKEVISKIVGIYLPISVFIASTYEHVVANFFLIPASMMLAAETTADNPLGVGEFIYKSIIPVTLGNICGATFFVALPYFWLFYSRSDTPEREIEKEGIEVAQVAPGPSAKDAHHLPLHMHHKH